MFYTIYKTTNTVNGKFYIGKHQTKDLNDGYMGSGKLIKAAIKKYGVDSFHKEILHVVQTEKEMDLLEKILVVPDQEINYNLCEGGKGGWSYIRNNLPNGMSGKRQTDKQKTAASLNLKNLRNKPEYSKMISDGQKRRYKTQKNPFKGKKHSNDSLEKISKANKGKVPWNKGIPRSEETKRKIRESILAKNLLTR